MDTTLNAIPSHIGEEWRPVSIANMPWLSERYYVSDKGRVFGAKSGKILAALDNACGYHFYHLSFNGKVFNFMAHRIVAMAFIPNPENKPEVNHIDGNKHNNALSNLEWVTPSENCLHAVTHLKRRCPKGEENGMSQLSESDITQIRAWWKTGDVSQGSIAAKWGISFQHASLIINRKRWRHVA